MAVVAVGTGVARSRNLSGWWEWGWKDTTQMLQEARVGWEESCQGSEGPWCTAVLRDGSRVAEHMSIHPSAYETFHDVMPVD
jgi:hypothetical protein